MAKANAASIYAPLTAAQVINCGTWCVYGFAIGDPWVYGPNSAGLGLGLVQLALKMAYPSAQAVTLHGHGESKRLVGKACSDDESLDSAEP